ncbi:ferredoxin [Kibdelosporangium banguiense]|uniref:Ferredoxin n=1 Tax=Kibdelosporangium banguiense TaxID=1365924 RepID=A0ABS4T730_9PSEU|nr:ferredoxin [Kibdelosporangium banguiense]MBP2320193.1 ferredoxin [Kibdelosporangium banguiense]
MKGQRVRLKVDNDRCERFAICEMEAPDLFQLSHDGRLLYTKRPVEDQVEQAIAAARCCPQQAIKVNRV